MTTPLRLSRPVILPAEGGRAITEIMDSYRDDFTPADCVVLLSAIQSATTVAIKAAKAGDFDKLNGTSQRIEAMSNKLHSIAKRQSLG